MVSIIDVNDVKFQWNTVWYVFFWSDQVRPSGILPWIYHNPTSWLISMSSDAITWVTIADKNLWATAVYNDRDTLSEANCGKFYQWGNNYWFPFTWAVNTSNVEVDATGYWPWNYYSGSTFICDTLTWDWTSPSVDNLWWWDTGTLAAMQWPCPSGFHIPSATEWSNLLSIGGAIWHWALAYSFPNPWYIDSWRWEHYWEWSWMLYWTAEYTQGVFAVAFNWVNLNSFSQYKTYWYSIRPFKNTAVAPDETWEIIYRPLSYNYYNQ